MEDALKEFNAWAPRLVDLGINLLVALLILVIGWWVSALLGRWVRRIATRSSKIDPTIVPMFYSTVVWTVRIFTLIAVLARFGVQTASLIAVLGLSLIHICTLRPNATAISCPGCARARSSPPAFPVFSARACCNRPRAATSTRSVSYTHLGREVAGVVDQDVDVGMGGADRGGAVGGGQVGLHGMDLGARVLARDGVGGLLELVGVAAMQHHLGAGLGQALGDGQADAAGRTGDQGFLAVEFDFHGGLQKRCGGDAIITQWRTMKNRLASDSVSIFL